MIKGPLLKSIFLLAGPLLMSNLLQQLYNIADTIIVGRFVGNNALGAVGSAFTLMNFIISVIYGLSLGSGSIFSIRFGEKDKGALRQSVQSSFVLIFTVTLLLNFLVYLGMDKILSMLNVPESVYPFMKEYMNIIFLSLMAIFLINFYGALYRAIGDSKTPMYFLSFSVISNIVLDYIFVAKFNWGIQGAAWATVLAQYLGGLSIAVKAYFQFPDFRLKRNNWHVNYSSIRVIFKYSFFTCVQQSVMSFGILMIQGLINSFGEYAMAAYAAAVKIGAFAYMPLQDFANAFSIFIAQNYGADEFDRIRKGLKMSIIVSAIFSGILSILILLLAENLLNIFISDGNIEIISIGSEYLRVEGAFYVGIGWLFLLYGFYRGIALPEMSIVLTIFSLGTRVLIAYLVAPIESIGLSGVWWSIPIGWFLADAIGFIYYAKSKKKLLAKKEEL